MAWRALTSGPMIEVSGGQHALPGGRTSEVVSVQIANAGDVYKDVSASFRERYAEGDEYVHSLIEYGELEKSEDDDGETKEVFVAKEFDATPSEAPATDEEAATRVEAAEKSATEAQDSAERALKAAQEQTSRAEALQSELTDAKAEGERLSGELQAANDQLGTALSYGDLSKDALVVEAEKKGVTVTRSAAGQGDPSKDDYVKALEEARTAS